MKAKRLILSAMCAGIAMIGFTSCDDYDEYSIDAPADLQARIDAAAATGIPSNGDTTIVDIMVATVGEKDNSSAWWTVFSDDFEVPVGKLLHLEFENYGTGVNNWNNWNLCTANMKGAKSTEENSNYSEYFLLRSDRYGWGGTSYDAALLSTDYGDGFGISWAEWLAVMNGAYVTMEIDHSSLGPTYVTVSQLGTDGNVYTETLIAEGTSSTESIYAWLVCDGSHFEMKKAYLIPSKIKEIPDEMPVSISIAGMPTAVELGDEDFWGSAVATVTYTDGTTAVIDTTDLSFVVIPDMTEVGTKVVSVAYSQTKQGNYCKAVTTAYTISVTAKISSIEVTTIETPTYYYPAGTTSVKAEDITPASFITSVIGKTGTTDINIPTSEYSVEITTVPATLTDDFVITIKYKEFTTTFNIAIAPRLEAETISFNGLTIGEEAEGLYNVSFWGLHTPYTKVNVGSDLKFSFINNNNEGCSNWENFVIVLTNGLCTIDESHVQTNDEGYEEFGAIRGDNYGWGWLGGIEPTMESNHDWDLFNQNLHGAKVTVEIINYGTTCDVKCSWTGSSDGVEYFQNYLGISISGDLYIGFTNEKSQLIFD